MNKITVLIVDDHELIRDAWAALIHNDPRFEVIGEANSPEKAVPIASDIKPNIVLMDINMSPIDGFEGTKMIRTASPVSRIIGVSMNAIPDYAKQLFKMGARGYVTKGSSKDELIEAILKVNAGEKYICNEVKNILADQKLDENEESPNLNILSRRELQVVKLIADGLTSKDISEQLKISTKTVEVHRYNVLKKLNIKNAAMLVNYVNKQGFQFPG